MTAARRAEVEAALHRDRCARCRKAAGPEALCARGRELRLAVAATSGGARHAHEWLVEGRSEQFGTIEGCRGCGARRFSSGGGQKSHLRATEPRRNPGDADTLRPVGDVRGSLSYKGACRECRRQFLSDSDLVSKSGRCERCARRGATRNPFPTWPPQPGDEIVLYRGSQRATVLEVKHSPDPHGPRDVRVRLPDGREKWLSEGDVSWPYETRIAAARAGRR